MSNGNLNEFILLLDDAIFEAEKVYLDAASKNLEWLQLDSGLVKKNLEDIKLKLISGDLKASNGCRLGITRALSEMDMPDDLYFAGKKVDDFYESKWV